MFTLLVSFQDVDYPSQWQDDKSWRDTEINTEQSTHIANYKEGHAREQIF